MSLQSSAWAWLSIVGPVAVGMTLVLIIGGIDLSVASILALTMPVLGSTTYTSAGRSGSAWSPHLFADRETNKPTVHREEDDA